MTGYGVSVLRDIAGRLASRMDGTALLWLSGRSGPAATASGELAVLRTVAITALVAAPVVPLLLSLAMPLSLALPVGTALVAAGAMVAGVVAVALCRAGRSRLDAALPQTALSEAAATLPAPYDLLAGLVTVHDGSGDVLSVHGRDRASLLRGLRDPAGRGFLEQIHVSDRIAFLQAIDDLRQGVAHATIDIRLNRPDAALTGEQFLYLRCDMARLVGDDGDNRPGVLVQSHDLSGEVRLKNEIRALGALAEQANESKTRFLAAVSHELRTPLNAILGFSGILAGEYFGRLENDRQREYVDLIHSSGQHLLSVVNTMLDMSKIEAGRYELVPEPFAVADSIRACEGMLSLQANEKGVHLTSRIMRGVGEIDADQRAFQQILINLVGNAIKFTDRGGLVTIDAAIDGPDLLVTVSDTGIGIAEDKLGLLGQPFVQVQNDLTRRYEGTGLGLALVKGLVSLHGGTFRIRSRIGEGTVILITIPLDGSGIAAAQTGTQKADEFEFPPRLMGRTDRTKQSAGWNGEAGHDGAQTKIA